MTPIELSGIILPMKIVTLTRVLDPDRKIVAIKNLRQATRPPEGVPGEVMGLKAAKDIVDALADPMLMRTAQVIVHDEPALRESFDYDVIPADSFDRDLIVEFILDVLAWSDPDTARRIQSLPSYARLRAAL